MKLNKLLALAVACSLSLSLVACSSDTTDTSGSSSSSTTTNSTTTSTSTSSEAVLSGSAQGFGGEIPVEVTMDGDTIVAIEFGEHTESAGISDAAFNQIPVAILENQSVAIDTVSGATLSSQGIIDAVTAALVSGGFDINNYMSAVTSSGEISDVTVDTDIVVVGAGGAGLTAAIEIANSGKDVVIVEKMSFAGGNTIKATAGMNAAETSVQAASDVYDDVETFISDTYDGGYNIGNIDLITIMAEKSAAAVDWLATVGAELVQVSFGGGATYARTHQPEGGSAIGAFLIENLVAEAESLGIDIIYNTEATEILMDGDAAVGIIASSSDTNYTFNSSAVILATGGFGANEELYSSYNPDLAGFVTTNHSGATGDGIVMAEAVGAGLVDIEQIQTHPTVHQETCIMVTESVRGYGGILVNQEGVRFINELETRDVVCAAEVAQTGGYAYAIFDETLRQSLSATSTYINSGITVQGDTIEELAEAIGCDPTTLADTLATWNQAVADQNDAEFGRTTGMDVDLSVGPYYAIQISPGVHHTMGGVAINTDAEVITDAGVAIPGLYAAGEITGGIHGGNRLAGNAVTDIVVFGLIAAESAVNYIG